jgi:hypothetical protein
MAKVLSPNYRDTACHSEEPRDEESAVGWSSVNSRSFASLRMTAENRDDGEKSLAANDD